MMMEFKVLSDCYRDVNTEEGPKEVLIKPNVVTKRFIDTHDISCIDQVYNDKAVIYKSRCIIHVRDIGAMLLSHSYEELKKIKSESLSIGFKR